MAPTFSIEAAAVVDLVIETGLYGFSMFMFGVTIWALVYKRSAPRLNKLMLATTLVLFLLSSLHLVFDTRRVYFGLVVESDQGYLEDNAHGTAKNIVYELELLTADAVLIYRCYVVWRSIWVIIPAIMGWISVAVSGGFTIWSIAKPVQDSTIIFLTQTARWVISLYSLALATNLYTTLFLAYRIWKIDREASMIGRRGSSLWPVVRVIIECGALYSVSLIVMIIVYKSGSNAAYVVEDMIGQIIPITFYMIIIRITMARMAAKGGTDIPLSEPIFVGQSTRQTQAGMSTGNDHRVVPFEVHISSLVDCETISVGKDMV